MSKANDFLKGQKVIGKENVDNEVEKGKVYTVSKVEGDFIHCEELECGHFYFYFKHSADEMFKEIGYRKIEEIINNFLVVTYINKFKERIIFDVKYKTVIAETENGFAKPISILELQAINEKVEELG